MVRGDNVFDSVSREAFELLIRWMQNKFGVGLDLFCDAIGCSSNRDGEGSTKTTLECTLEKLVITTAAANSLANRHQDGEFLGDWRVIVDLPVNVSLIEDAENDDPSNQHRSMQFFRILPPVAKGNRSQNTTKETRKLTPDPIFSTSSAIVAMNERAAGAPEGRKRTESPFVHERRGRGISVVFDLLRVILLRDRLGG